MNTPATHFALRKWRTQMTEPVRATALIGAAVILAIMGPFETAQTMRPLPRLIYWLALVGLGYSAGYFAHVCADRIAPGSTVKRIAIAGPLTGIVVLAIVYLVNAAALGYWPRGRDLALLVANVVAIATILSAVLQFAHSPHRRDPTEREQDRGAPALLDRLPLDKRAPLVSISVEDHYVRIRTTKGEEMVLLRLADAIREVGDTPGLQVHRSHWVALGQVTSVARRGDGARLTMTHGDAIPVSRANMAHIKEAGLLPR